MAASNKWSCSTCLASNESDRTTCACCQTKKETPSELSPVKPTNSLFAAAKTANANKWSCSTCLASNESDRITCACCQSKRQVDQPKNVFPSIVSQVF